LRTLTDVAACAFVHAAVNVALVPNVADTALTVAPCAFAHASTTPTIAVTHNLLVDVAAVSLAASAPALNELRTLAVNNAAFTEAATTPTIAVTHVLAVDMALLGHVADAFGLTQAHRLAVHDAIFGVTASSPVVSSIVPTMLIVAPAAVALEAQEVMHQAATLALLVPIDLAPRQYTQNVDPRQYKFDSRERAYIINVDPRLRT